MRLRISDSKAVMPHPGAGAASREPAAAVAAGTLDPPLLCAFSVPKSLSSALSGGGFSSWAWWKSRWREHRSGNGLLSKRAWVSPQGLSGVCWWEGRSGRVARIPRQYLWLVSVGGYSSVSHSVELDTTQLLEVE